MPLKVVLSFASNGVKRPITHSEMSQGRSDHLRGLPLSANLMPRFSALVDLGDLGGG